MADKFPAIESVDDDSIVAGQDDVAGADFLSREQELLGDEFKTEQDREVLAASDDEINEFNEQFPDVEESAAVAVPVVASEAEDDYEFSQPVASKFEGESAPLKEWKQRRDLEISERESANSKKKQEIVAKAQQTVDDFYDNYNIKKEQHSKEVLKEQDEYLEKRDGFLKRGTLWDRVNEIVSEVGDLPESEDRDKSRFKDLLGKLKGKENAPGAGGY
ncbi:hypothetical protein PICST_75094 [Scheffersomyces stipitis CBS 6054]|uniref:Clathrin light chain n=1 Tax=Scheffersomyces stipitis (strain ATCC 58785 / CBS 6054 / NBRC 10063 / NRRL Y-11545) TaxID=322104 RepID=A3GGE6_PICST|nr:predicted protein [Scheffersomyces stipitis CBS 6054]EAZ63919.1 hypothetical protein PICST_75094 [Scheffersomyces stipitis CBS 6054]KAG2735041.1 hypothetical protein G9P44_001255 [Scheffersomyces stipitis]